jgi:hypothetical protein
VRIRPVLLTFAALAALTAGFGCVVHTQRDGAYAFTALEVLRDSCGLLPSPEALWDGELFVTGETLRLDYQLFEMRLVGAFEEVSNDFYLDGSAANVSAEVGGQECQFDLVTVSVKGTTRSPTQFTGSLRLTQQGPLDRCNCELWLTYRADRQ